MRFKAFPAFIFDPEGQRVGFSGVESVDIDLKEQKVVVKGNVSQDDILQTVSKTGKKTELWQ